LEKDIKDFPEEKFDEASVTAGNALSEINFAIKASGFGKSEIIGKEQLLKSVIIFQIWRDKLFLINPPLQLAVEGLANKDFQTLMNSIEFLNLLRENHSFDKLIKLGETVTKINLIAIYKLLIVISKIEHFKDMKSSLVSVLSGNSDIKKMLNDRGILGVLDSIRKHSNEFGFNPQKDLGDTYKHKLIRELKYYKFLDVLLQSYKTSLPQLHQQFCNG